MKIAGRLFGLFYRLAGALLVFCAGALLILLLFGVHPYVVRTGSMEPTIRTGSICFVDQRASLKDVREGDVITYKLGDLYVTHRAVRVDETGVTTRGDANNIEDRGGKVTAENFVGKTVFWVPCVGKLLLYARSASGRWVVGGIFLLFLIAGFLYDKLRAEASEPEAS